MNVTFTAKDILELRQRGAIDLKSRAGTFLNVGGVGFELERLHSDGQLMDRALHLYLHFVQGLDLQQCLKVTSPNSALWVAGQFTVKRMEKISAGKVRKFIVARVEWTVGSLEALACCGLTKGRRRLWRGRTSPQTTLAGHSNSLTNLKQR